MTLKTDSLSTVEIKWEDVKSVSSKFAFVVETSEGILYVGVLQPAGEPQKLNIVGRSPASNLDQLSIVEIKEVGSSIWSRFSGDIELGYTYAKARNNTQLNVSSDLTYRTKRFDGQFTYDAMISVSNGVAEVNRRVFSPGGSLYLRKRWQLLSKALWEHNLELQLDKRFSVLMAPAYNVLKSNRSSFLLIGGMAYS